jgi:hypothetical protein
MFSKAVEENTTTSCTRSSKRSGIPGTVRANQKVLTPSPSRLV